MRVALIGRDGIEIGIETIDGVGPNGLWPTQMPFSLASREFEEGQLQCVREEKEEENLIMCGLFVSPQEEFQHIALLLVSQLQRIGVVIKNTVKHSAVPVAQELEIVFIEPLLVLKLIWQVQCNIDHFMTRPP